MLDQNDVPSGGALDRTYQGTPVITSCLDKLLWYVQKVSFLAETPL